MNGQTLFFEQALLPQGWTHNVRIAIEDGRIARVETGAAASAEQERHAIAVPALSNVHSHAFQRGMAGLSETRGSNTDNFWTWREVMYRFLAVLNPDDVQAIAAQAYVEMLEEGFTRVGEFHYLHHDPAGRPYANIGEMAERIAEATQASGIGLTLLPVFYAHSNFGGRPPAEGQRRFICDLDTFARLVDVSATIVSRLPGANFGIAPHSLRAVTPSELNVIKPLACNGPIHIHASEQTKEVDDCISWSGQRPVEWLLNHQSIDARWCVIHATHINPAETCRLAQSGAVAGLCPVTEANLGDGIFNLPGFLECGGKYGIGTDSNIRVGAADELRQLEYAQRLGTRSRNIASTMTRGSTGRALFDAALSGGGQALMQSVSGLAHGASADIISLDPNHPAFAVHREDVLLDGWIFGSRHGIIDCVWSMGRKLVVNGRHRDHEAVAAEFRRVIGKVAC